MGLQCAAGVHGATRTLAVGAQAEPLELLATLIGARFAIPTAIARPLSMFDFTASQGQLVCSWREFSFFRDSSRGAEFRMAHGRPSEALFLQRAPRCTLHAVQCSVMWPCVESFFTLPFRNGKLCGSPSSLSGTKSA